MPLPARLGVRPLYRDIHNHCDQSYGRGRLEDALKRATLQQIILDRMSRAATVFRLDRLGTFDVPNAPTLFFGDALDQPHVAARCLVETAHQPTDGALRLVRGPIRFEADYVI